MNIFNAAAEIAAADPAGWLMGFAGFYVMCTVYERVKNGAADRGRVK